MQPLVLLQKVKLRECSLGRRCAASCIVHPVCTVTQKSGNSLCISQKNNQKHTKKSSTLFSLWESSVLKSSREVVKSLSLEILKIQHDMALSSAAGKDLMCHLSDSVSLSSHWEKLQTVGNNCIPNLQILSMWHPASDLTTLWLALRKTQF